MTRSSVSFARAAVAAGVVGALVAQPVGLAAAAPDGDAAIEAAVAAGYPGGPTSADVAELRALQEQAVAAADALDAAEARLAEAEDALAENTARIAELEAQLPDAQRRAAAAIRSEYKLNSAEGGILALLLSAESFEEFVSMGTYLARVSSYHAEQMSELVALRDELAEAQEALSAQRDEAEAARAAAEEATASADEAVAAARAKATEKAAAAKAAYEAEQAAKAKAEAEAAAAAAAESEQETKAPEASSGASASEGSGDSSGSSSGGSSGDAPASSAADPVVPSASGSGEYTWVAASTYGIGDGLLYSGTADGSVVTPTSMGVAMRTMPLGTIVEITYNGRTCTAVVNDRGPYYGNRQIDLQPAVAEALAFPDIGTVGYRVVG